MIERHITLDKTMKGTDHACSLDVQEFGEMITAIRTMEKALGSGEKKFLDSEKSCFGKLGKTVVAGKELPMGHVLSMEDLSVKVIVSFLAFLVFENFPFATPACFNYSNSSGVRSKRYQPHGYGSALRKIPQQICA